MKGDPGPYMNDDGDVWVPRTVPYLEARRLAKAETPYSDDRLEYVGKEDTDLFGFTRDCYCEDYCLARYVDDEPTGETPCRVPAWRFRVVDRWGDPRPRE